MRDPEASITIEGSKVTRGLRRPLQEAHFLRSALAGRWAARGDLVPFRLVGPSCVESDRIPFVTYPYEWCDSQLFQAASLTLRLQQEAVDAGFDLKDASAWNVIFRGQEPIFCDLLSFQPLQQQRWWAAGQFARHFILPLLLSRKRGVHGYQVFLAWRDGLPPDVGRRLLGWPRFLTRYWPLVAAGAEPSVGKPVARSGVADRVSIERFRRGLQASLSWMLEGLEPAKAGRAQREGAWLGYSMDRAHYPGASVGRKRETVAGWLAQLGPKWVADLGCNDGEFALLALEVGAHVVAVDGDHDCIDKLFRHLPANGRLFPVIAPLDDLTAGRGWAGREYPGLPDRLADRVDVVLMLALLHHLAIGAAIPLDEVAALAARCSRSHLVVEWIDASDPQLRMLCAQRQREPGDFGIEVQRAAFVGAGFVIEHEVSLEPAARTLALLRRKPS